MKYSNYYRLDGSTTILFNVEECESCGDVCQEVNSIRGIVSDIPKYNSSGMVEMTTLPPEQEFNDEHGVCVCDNCP